MKIAFLDHPLHRKTKSSDFFVEILRQSHEVQIFYPGSEWRFVLEEILEAKCDLAICWQHEFYAPPLAINGLRTLIIPMYDGSGSMAPIYWRFFARLGIEALNFSANLNHQHLIAGIASQYVQYFPNPDDFEPVEDFTTLRGFLWQRRPDHHLHWHTAIRMTCGQLAHLHIHDVPDLPVPPNIPKIEDWPLLAKDITRSTWFETKEEFLAVMKRANVYFAPRLSEGIGMANLEAMAQGQCVLAHRESTHNEYLKHGANGLLFDLSHVYPIDLSRAKQLGKAARETVIAGYDRWLASHPTIEAKIENLRSPRVNGIGKRQAAVAAEFPKYYQKGLRALYRLLQDIL